MVRTSSKAGCEEHVYPMTPAQKLWGATRHCCAGGFSCTNCIVEPLPPHREVRVLQAPLRRPARSGRSSSTGAGIAAHRPTCRAMT